MPQALVTTKPNELRSIEVWDVSAIQGWYLLGIWQWLAWNRLKFFSKLLSKFVAREQRLTERRCERDARREFLRHYDYGNPWNFWAALTAYLTWVKFLSFAEYSKRLAQLLKALTPIPKFCNGLIGNSLTDSVTAPAI